MSYHKKATLKILNELIGTLYAMGPHYQPAIDEAERLDLLLRRLHNSDAKPIQVYVKQVPKGGLQ